VAQPTTDLYIRLAAAYVRGMCAPVIDDLGGPPTHQHRAGRVQFVYQFSERRAVTRRVRVEPTRAGRQISILERSSDTPQSTTAS
jgi:hypothetical protein